jgi:hypothetical protein
MVEDSYFVLLTDEADCQRLFYLRLDGAEIPMIVCDDATLLRLVAIDQDFHIYRVWPGTALATLALANEGRELRKGMAARDVLLEDDFARDIAAAVARGEVCGGCNCPVARRASS